MHPYCAELLDVLEDNRNWYSSRVVHSSSSSSVTDSARQVSSPTTDDSPSGGDLEPPADTAADDARTSTAGESDNDEQAEFVVLHHPAGVQSPLPLQKTFSGLFPTADKRCPHPEMPVRRASEGTGIGTPGDAETRVTGCASDVAINGVPQRQQSSPSSITTYHKPVAH